MLRCMPFVTSARFPLQIPCHQWCQNLISVTPTRRFRIAYSLPTTERSQGQGRRSRRTEPVRPYRGALSQRTPRRRARPRPGQGRLHHRSGASPQGPREASGLDPQSPHPLGSRRGTAVWPGNHPHPGKQTPSRAGLPLLLRASCGWPKVMARSVWRRLAAAPWPWMRSTTRVSPRSSKPSWISSPCPSRIRDHPQSRIGVCQVA